jgi:hypothetical protein
MCRYNFSGTSICGAGVVIIAAKIGITTAEIGILPAKLTSAAFVILIKMTLIRIAAAMIDNYSGFFWGYQTYSCKGR